MSEPVDLHIGITVDTSELEKATTSLNNFYEAFIKAKVGTAMALATPETTGTTQLQNAIAGVTKTVEQSTPAIDSYRSSMQGLSGISLDSLFENLDKSGTFMVKFARTLGITTEDVKDAFGAIYLAEPGEKLSKVTENLYSLTERPMNIIGLQSFQQNVDAIYGLLGKLQGVTLPKEWEEFKPPTASLKQYQESMLLLYNTIQQMQGAPAGIAPVTQAKEITPLENAYKELQATEKQGAMIQGLMSSAYKLTADQIAALPPEIQQNIGALQRQSAEMEKARILWQSYRNYIRGMREEIGPLGYAFRDVGMQVYWASLGFLFLTMTMVRADKTALQIERRTLDLAQAYYNLSELQKQAGQTAIEYGAGSEEARKASVQLDQQTKSLALQEKQLALTIKTEVLQNYQQYLSMIPLMINSTYTIMTLMGSLNGIYVALNGTQLTYSATSVAGIAIKQEEAGATFMQIAAHLGLQGALMAELAPYANAILALIGFQINEASTIVMTEMLTAALTLGIGAIISLATVTLIQAQAQAQADEQMKKMKAEAESQAGAWEGLGGSISDTNRIFEGFGNTVASLPNEIEKTTGAIEGTTDSLTGHSLYDAIMKVRGAFRDYESGLSKVRTTSMTYSIDSKIIPPKIPQLSSQINTSYSNPPSIDLEPLSQNIGLNYSGIQAPIMESLQRDIVLKYIASQVPFLEQLQQGVSLQYLGRPSISFDPISQLIGTSYSQPVIPELPGLNEDITLQYSKNRPPVLDQLSQDVGLNYSITSPVLPDMKRNVGLNYGKLSNPILEQLEQYIGLLYSNVQPPDLMNLAQGVDLKYSIESPVLQRLNQNIGLKYDKLSSPVLDRLMQQISIEYTKPELPGLQNLRQNVSLKYLLQDPTLKTLERQVNLDYNDNIPALTELSRNVNIANIQNIPSNKERPVSVYAPIQVNVTGKENIPNISKQIEDGLVRAVKTRGRLE